MSKTTKGRTPKKQEHSKAMEDALKAVENMGKISDKHEEIAHFLGESVQEAFETIKNQRSGAKGGKDKKDVH